MTDFNPSQPPSFLASLYENSSTIKEQALQKKVNESQQREKEANKKLHLQQKPEEALSKIKNADFNPETYWSLCFLILYLSEEVTKLKTKTNNKQEYQPAKNAVEGLSKWDSPCSLKGVVLFVLGAITAPIILDIILHCFNFK